jgi:hypothetical protein
VVYGIIGLASEDTKGKLTISYKLSMEDVYLQAEKQLSRGVHGVDYLLLIGSQCKVRDLPTWYFDQHAARTTKLFTISSPAGLFPEDEPNRDEWCLDAHDDLTMRRLGLSAYHVDTVQATTVNPNNGSRPQAWDRWATWLMKCRKIATSLLTDNADNAFELSSAHDHVLTTAPLAQCPNTPLLI